MSMPVILAPVRSPFQSAQLLLYHSRNGSYAKKGDCEKESKACRFQKSLRRL